MSPPRYTKMLLPMLMVLDVGLFPMLFVHSKKLNANDFHNIQPVLPNTITHLAPVDNPKSRSRSKDLVMNTLSKLFRKALTLTTNSSKVYPINSETETQNAATVKVSEQAKVLFPGKFFVELVVWTDCNALAGDVLDQSASMEFQSCKNFISTKLKISTTRINSTKIGNSESFSSIMNLLNEDCCYRVSNMFDLFIEITYKLTKYKAKIAYNNAGLEEYKPPFILKLIPENSNIDDTTILSSNSPLTDLLQIILTKSIRYQHWHSQYFLNLLPILEPLPFELDISLYIYIGNDHDLDSCSSLGDCFFLSQGGAIIIDYDSSEKKVDSDFESTSNRFTIGVERKYNSYDQFDSEKEEESESVDSTTLYQNSFITFGYLKQEIVKKYGRIGEKLNLSSYNFRYRKSGHTKINTNGILNFTNRNRNYNIEDLQTIPHYLKCMNEPFHDTDSIQLGNKLLKTFGPPRIDSEPEMRRRYIRPGCDYLSFEKIVGT